MKPSQVLLLLGLLLVPRAGSGQEAPEPPAAAAGEEEAAAGQAAAAPEPAVFDPEAYLARQEKRCIAAEARTRAAGLALAGAIPIEEGFPQLARAPLDSVAWVTGRLAELDERGKAYAAERRAEIPGRTPGDPARGEQVPEGESAEAEPQDSETGEEGTGDRPPAGRPPEGRPPEDEDPLRAAREAALDTLMAADELERRFLLAVLVHLEEHPQLTRTALAATRRDLAARVAAEEAFFADVDPASAGRQARQVVSAQHQLDRLEELQRRLLLHSTVGEPLPELAPDIRLLDDPEQAAVAELRLGLLLPFLAGERLSAVTEALAHRRQARAAAAAEAAAEAEAARLEASAAERLLKRQQAAAVAEEDARQAKARLEGRGEEIAAQMAGFRKALVESRKAVIEIETRPPLDPNRRKDADRLYRDLRGLVGKMLAAVAAEDVGASRLSIDADRALAVAQNEAAEARARIERLEEDVAAGDVAPAPELFERWRQALTRRVRAAAALAELEERHRDELFVVIKDAKALRRDFESEVSGKAIAEDRLNLFADLRTEAELVYPNMQALAGHRWGTVRELPSQWRDWNVASALLVNTFWVLFVGALWLGSRRQAPAAVPRLLDRWAIRGRRYALRDVENMEKPAQSALRASIDLAAGTLLLRLLGDALPELGLVILIYLQVALYRLLVGLTSLAVACYPEVRPALATLEPKAHKMLLRTVKVLALWLIVRQFLRNFATRILAAMTLDEVLRLGFNLLLVGLAIWLLYLWEPVLRAALRRRDSRQPLVAFLTRRPLGPLAALQSLAQAIAWVALWARDLSLKVLQKTAATGAGDQAANLPGELIAKLLHRECPEAGYIERPATRGLLDQALRDWQTGRRRGAAMLMGGQGAGKRTFLGHWCRLLKDLEGRELPVKRDRLAKRLTTGEEACDWLAKALSIDDPPAKPEALAGRIHERLKGHVVVLEDLHFAFLRRVDGFAALRFLLSVVGAASSKVFWLLSMHRPGWKYLDSLGGFLNTEACQQVIELEAFDDKDLRLLLEHRLKDARHEVDFARLLPRGARKDASADADAEGDSIALARITDEYYRRLAWVSQGSPGIALRLWRENLVQGWGEGRLEVKRLIQAAALPKLHDPELFLLTAIYTHRALTEKELAAVTNMNAAQVNAAVRNLEAQSLLAGRAKRFAIEPRFLPAVTAELKRRHFLHGSL